MALLRGSVAKRPEMAGEKIQARSSGNGGENTQGGAELNSEESEFQRTPEEGEAQRSDDDLESSGAGGSKVVFQKTSKPVEAGAFGSIAPGEAIIEKEIGENARQKAQRVGIDQKEIAIEKGRKKEKEGQVGDGQVDEDPAQTDTGELNQTVLILTKPLPSRKSDRRGALCKALESHKAESVGREKSHRNRSLLRRRM